MNLLDLPPELIAQIWSHLPIYGRAAKRPLCRTLLPFTRRALFRNVYIPRRRLQTFSQLLRPTNSRQVKALRSTLDGDRPLGLNIRELFLTAVRYEPDEEDSNPDCKAVRRVLSSASNVERLTIEGSGLLKLLLPPEGAFRLTKVRSLHLESLDAKRIHLYDMQCLGQLKFWPGLRKLSMHVERWGEEQLAEADVAHPHRDSPLPRIHTLELSAGVSLSTPSASNFIAHFTGLTTLSLELSIPAPLSSFLEAASLSLTSLSIYLDIDEDTAEQGIVLDPLLGRFANLTTLHLGERTYSSHLFRLICHSLPRMSTLDLACGRHVQIDASRLQAYLRCRPRSLESLTLDAFDAKPGLIPSKTPHDPRIASGVCRLEQSWVFPLWTTTFSFEDAKEIVRLADEAGIELRGSLLYAIEVEELKVRENKYLQDRADDILLSLAALFSQS
ncbi:hypothetical protein JCM11251_000651 [Rhodosporidiobolus azoricus]